MSSKCCIFTGILQAEGRFCTTLVYFFSSEPGLSMCIYTSFGDYTVCHSISCYHRGSQSLWHSLWFISPTCFTPTHCEHCWETLLWTASASDLPSCACVCICVSVWCVLQVCQHPNSRMREWGAEALTALIKAGLAYKHDPPLAQNQVADTSGVSVQKHTTKNWKTRICLRKMFK